MHFLHSDYKKLYSPNHFQYFHRMRLFIVLSMICCSFSVAASCENEALLEANIQPNSVSKTTTPGLPDENGNFEMVVEVRGEKYGSMVILCDTNGNFIRFVNDYRELGQY